MNTGIIIFFCYHMLPMHLSTLQWQNMPVSHCHTSINKNVMRLFVINDFEKLLNKWLWQIALDCCRPCAFSACTKSTISRETLKDLCISCYCIRGHNLHARRFCSTTYLALRFLLQINKIKKTAPTSKVLPTAAPISTFTLLSFSLLWRSLLPGLIENAVDVGVTWK